MSTKQLDSNRLLSDLYRQEHLKMIAVLCSCFGLKHIEVAEDIIGETFLKASENWATASVPEIPAAWLYTVAKNKAKDYLKRNTIFETIIAGDIKPEEGEPEWDFELSSKQIEDSQLAMIFAVCDPSNSKEGQVCLALQVLCGFSVEEIANAFLSKVETIKKRLLRARSKLRESHFQIQVLSEFDIKFRQDSVLKTLYLLFNEGYFSRTSNQLIRNELCAEAIRLTLILTENLLTDTIETKALLALMCYQSSRLEARTNDRGEALLFEEQDQNLWNKDLIEKGNYYLVQAFQGDQVSKYHLEAGIAYWHTNKTAKDKWQHILNLYNQLVLTEYSPITALNRAFAIAKVYGYEKAILETEKLKLDDNDQYHKLLGYLYETIETDKAIDHYSTAVQLTKSKTAKQILLKKIAELIAKS
nr:sigma-70 family RNA polymerase sigma factor [Pedobacter panaciterrae]